MVLPDNFICNIYLPSLNGQIFILPFSDGKNIILPFICQLHLSKKEKTVTTPDVQLRLSLLLHYISLFDYDLPLQAVDDFLFLFRS